MKEQLKVGITKMAFTDEEAERSRCQAFPECRWVLAVVERVRLRKKCALQSML